MAKISAVELGAQGFKVSPQGLGCMGMYGFLGPPKPEEDMIQLIRKAIECGITMLDTADVYGPYKNEILVGKAIRGLRDKVQLCTKFGFYSDASGLSVRGDPEYVRSCCEQSLKRLGVDCIDLYYQHRVDPKVPIEITMGELKKLVEEGKIKYVGLSEASPAEIRRAHAVHPITAVQMEYSLWTRDIEQYIIPTCRELGIGVVAYSPLGRGFFSGFSPGQFAEGDGRKYNPRFSRENYEHNKQFYERLVKIAEGRHCKPGQLALAWLQHRGVVPIPGTTTLKNLEENMASLKINLSSEDILSLENAVPEVEVKGERNALQKKDAWQFSKTFPLEQWTGVRQ